MQIRALTINSKKAENGMQKFSIGKKKIDIKGTISKVVNYPACLLMKVKKGLLGSSLELLFTSPQAHPLRSVGVR